MAMSLSMGGYGQGYPHPGPMGQELYQYPPVRYPDHHGESGYFQNWVLNPAASSDLSVMGDTYPGCGPPADYHGMHGQYELGGMRVVKRRSTANKKERRRTLSINNAFMQLRNCIPNVPSDTKLSKIKTLRLATSYIAYLMEVLAKDDPKLTETGFKAELTKKVDKDDKKKKEASERRDRVASQHALLHPSTSPDNLRAQLAARAARAKAVGDGKQSTRNEAGGGITDTTSLCRDSPSDRTPSDHVRGSCALGCAAGR